jgi:hypothetical protein
MVKLNTTVLRAKEREFANTAKSDGYASCVVEYDKSKNVSTTESSSTVLTVKAEASVFTGTSKGLAKNARELTYARIYSTKKCARYVLQGAPMERYKAIVNIVPNGGFTCAHTV